MASLFYRAGGAFILCLYSVQVLWRLGNGDVELDFLDGTGLFTHLCRGLLGPNLLDFLVIAFGGERFLLLVLDVLAQDAHE